MDELDDKPAFPPSGSPGWLMPLVSMMAMLLAVCILLLSISRPDRLRLAEATSSIRSAFGLDVSDIILPTTGATNDSAGLQEAIAFEQAIQLVRIKEKLERMQNRLPDAKGLEVMAVEEGFLIRLSRSTLFADGSVTLRPEVVPLLKEMAQMYARLPNVIRIDSHGGESKPSSSGGGMNSVWATSAAEAATLADFMVTVGGLDVARLIPSGHPAPRAGGPGQEGKGRGVGIEILLTREVRAEVKPPSGPAGVSSEAAAPGASK
ncbi:MAG: hypothetical protein HQL98_05020 [Magnetococcales bacterium]|nr:hypothetical protein [Magnetococcales bacterium]